jgi:preprotein translocase subunit SecG
MLHSLLNVLHVFVCFFLILVVLLQQGKGGGLGGLGGAAASQVFGGRGAGNFMTRLTAVCAFMFMATSMALAFISSGGDRALREFQKQQTEQNAPPPLPAPPPTP